MTYEVVFADGKKMALHAGDVELLDDEHGNPVAYNFLEKLVKEDETSATVALIPYSLVSFVVSQ